MATAETAPPQEASVQPPPVPVRRFSVAEYHRLAEAGILAPDERVELLEGWIVPKVTHHPPHASALTRLQRRLARLLDEGWLLRVQAPIAVPGSEPEPDVLIVPGPEDRFDSAHPVPRDVALLVEVADSSLAQDQGLKLQLYARVRIPVYWIVNLADGRVEVYTEPRGGKNPTFRRRQDYGPDEQVPVVLRGQQIGLIHVGELLP